MLKPIFIAAFALIAGPALADPCTAPVTGYTFGAQVSGKGRYVGDGDGLCIGPSPDPRTWIEIRLSDFYAPELHEPGGETAKSTLRRLAMGRTAVCTVGGNGRRTTSYDRLLAACSVGGRDLGDAMRAAGVPEGGRGRGAEIKIIP